MAADWRCAAVCVTATRVVLPPKVPRRYTSGRVLLARPPGDPWRSARRRPRGCARESAERFEVTYRVGRRIVGRESMATRRRDRATRRKSARCRRGAQLRARQCPTAAGPPRLRSGRWFQTQRRSASWAWVEAPDATRRARVGPWGRSSAAWGFPQPAAVASRAAR